MAAPYSYDLRKKLMSYIAEGKTVQEASRIYKIDRRTIYKWKKLKAATGDVRARQGYQIGHRQIIRDEIKFREFIEANNDKSSRELSRLWHQKISASGIIRTLKKLGYTYKKSFFSSQERCWYAF